MPLIRNAQLLPKEVQNGVNGVIDHRTQDRRANGFVGVILSLIKGNITTTVSAGNRIERVNVQAPLFDNCHGKSQARIPIGPGVLIKIGVSQRHQKKNNCHGPGKFHQSWVSRTSGELIAKVEPFIPLPSLSIKQASIARGEELGRKVEIFIISITGVYGVFFAGFAAQKNALLYGVDGDISIIYCSFAKVDNSTLT